MRRNVFFPREFDILFVKFCREKGITDYSALVRGALVEYMLNKKIGDKLKKAARIRKKNEELYLANISLRYELKRGFILHNTSKTIVKVIDACENKQQIFRIIKEYKNVARIMNSKETLDKLNEMETSLKQPKKFEAIKDECHRFASLIKNAHEKPARVMHR